MNKVSSRGLYIGDPHFIDHIPNRKDNFLNSISTKFQESLEIARNIGLDYLVILGDLFNQCEPPAVVRNKVVEILAKGNGGKKWPFDIFLTIGNHDLYYHSSSTLEKTAIKTLETTGLIKIVKSSEKYGIYFGHFEHGIEKHKINVDFPILAMHSNILPHKAIMDHVLISDFSTNDNNKLVVSGHYHDGYPIMEKSPGLFFANPGALGRISVTDMKRTVQVMMVELNRGEVDNIEYIPLTSAQPGSLIFDEKIIDAKKRKELDISEFVKSIDSAKIIINQKTDILGAIKQFGIDNNIEKQIIDEAVRRIMGVAKKEIENNDDE